MYEGYSTELYHHGILGQKWGVRRFQNEDGSLTAKGKKHYGYDRDVTDTSRENIAKIRLGEAKRRLDYAKIHGSSNTRKAELQGRVRSAKKAVRQTKQYDKGAARAAKGETISGNNFKKAVAYGTAAMGSALLTKALNKRLSTIRTRDGYVGQNVINAAKFVNTVGSYTLTAAAGIYAAKKKADNANIRVYQRSQWNGDKSIKRVGSQEYADRKKAASK
jgi:hypothetical protein